MASHHHKMEIEETSSLVDSECDDEGANQHHLLHLPDSILLKVLSYINSYQDISSVTQVSSRLGRVCNDEILWKNLFHRHFRIDDGLFTQPSYYPSWRAEFRRLIDECPSIECQVLTKHTDQVLHVSFSHDGKRFATSAKDGLIVVWKSGHPCTQEYSMNMKFFSWKYTQFSQFNESDTLLLVSGVLFGHNSTSGEISIFSLKDGFELQCRVMSKPYDIFGTWFSEMFFLSGQHRWLSSMVSKSVIWINKASQESHSADLSITNEMYSFYNPKASSVRSLLIANCVEDDVASGADIQQQQQSNPAVVDQKPQNQAAEESTVMEETRTGNPLSCLQHEPARAALLMQINSKGHQGTLQGAFNTWRPLDNIANIQYSEAYRNTNATDKQATTTTQAACSSASTSFYLKDQQRKEGVIGTSNSSSMEDLLLSSSNDDYDQDQEISTASASTSSPDNDDDKDVKNQRGDSVEEAYILDPRHKLLIFTCSSETYTPHRIGFKRIPPMPFKERLDNGPSVRERLEEYKRRRQLEIDGAPDPDDNINWGNFASVKDRFDEIDHIVDLHGHIIGMALSPDHRYLYVNSRPWPEGYRISNPLEPPPICSEIDIHVIDLKTITQVGMMRRAHRAYTPNEECFFIFLDTCDKFVGSGAEDKHGYIWDRHYGVSLIKLPHSDVVNAVAFNPKNSHQFVTVSDDFTIKIWRSRAQCRRLGIDLCDKSKQGTTLYNLRRTATAQQSRTASQS